MAAASPVGFDLHEVRLVDLVRIVYGDVLHKNYVLDSDAVGVMDLLTLKVQGVEPPVVERLLKSLLRGKGYDVENRDGVAFVSKIEHQLPERETVVYRPLYRAVGYFTDALTPLFPPGAFGGQRQLPQSFTGQQGLQPAQVPVGRGVVGQRLGLQPLPGQISGRDSGTSAYSMVDKGEQDVLVFTGTKKERERFAGLVEQLDKRAAEIVVKAVVYEVRKIETQGSALNLALSLLQGKIGLKIDGGATVGNSISVKIGDVDAVFAALSADRRFKLVSSPTIRMRSGTTAKFTAGSEVPVLGAVTTTTGAAVQSVDYKSAGVILDLTAQAREQGIDLRIGQQISSFVQTTTGVNQSPTLLKRELSTNVSAQSDDMIILGGLEEDQDTGDNTGLPWLPDWLRSVGLSKQGTEIVVLLNVQRI